MVRALVYMILGPLGIRVLEYYQANSLVINSVVLAYGVLIFISWRNLAGIRKRLVADMVRQLRQAGHTEAGMRASQVIKWTEIAWEESLRGVRFPLVARQTELWPKRVSLAAVQQMLDPKVLAADAIETLTGKRPKREDKPASRRAKSKAKK